MRRPEEVFVVVYRRGTTDPEFLVLKRSPQRQGYWHLVSGALDSGESAAAAATRELSEETGLEGEIVDLGLEYVYPLADEPPQVRARFAPDVEQVVVTAFATEALEDWEPLLDEEHVDYRWCAADDAVALLRYPEPGDAVRETDRRLREGIM
jgi:8-oxo-dGTP pyrophosphatase MutT (NUDIX family)